MRTAEGPIPGRAPGARGSEFARSPRGRAARTVAAWACLALACPPAGALQAPETATGTAPAGAAEAAGPAGAPAATPGPGAGTVLDGILARGTLRIGTTGDYAPFTFRGPDGALTGFDVEMGRALAASLDVRAEFVNTTWPTLLEDLRARRFDVAMSGVSRTLLRARHGLYSRPYHRGGKTPVGRCADRERFRDFDAIDAPGVRAVVNPGGTNERFARTHLRRASLRVHRDNETVFEELRAGRADVMFTDAIEVAVVTRRHRELCALLPGTLLQPVAKAYLLPRDPAWRAYVDLWLEHTARDPDWPGDVLERHVDRAASAVDGTP